IDLLGNVADHGVILFLLNAALLGRTGARCEIAIGRFIYPALHDGPGSGVQRECARAHHSTPSAARATMARARSSSCTASSIFGRMSSASRGVISPSSAELVIAPETAPPLLNSSAHFFISRSMSVFRQPVAGSSPTSSTTRP